MTIHGILLLDLVGVLFILAVLHLVRARGLTVAYGAVWIGALLLMIVVISFPPFLSTVTRAVGAKYPASALTLLAFLLAFGILIFFSVQLSRLSARMIELAQQIGLHELDRQETLEQAADEARSSR